VIGLSLSFSVLSSQSRRSSPSIFIDSSLLISDSSVQQLIYYNFTI
jgi:hypothetical protein